MSDSFLSSCAVLAGHPIVSCNPKRCSNKASTKFVVKDRLFVNSIRGMKL